MKDESANPGRPAASAASAPGLPMVELDPSLALTGPNTRPNGGSPAWPPVSVWPGGRPIAQWPRLEAGRCDDLAIRP